MAEKKPSGFRFRLPWLLQPAVAPRTAIAPEPPSQPPRITTQTSVASTSAQRPPFRPPGKAPTPVATVPPASPIRSMASMASPPPPVPAKSSVPESAIAKTTDPVTTQPTKEAQTATETKPSEKPNLTIPPEVGKTVVETQPTKETQTITKSLQDTDASSPDTPPVISKVVDTVESQPTKETQRTTENIPIIETPRPTTPPQMPPSLPQALPAKPDSQPSFPSRAGTQFQFSSEPVSPSRMPTPPPANSQPLSPSRMATQPHVPAKPPSSPSLGDTQTQAAFQTSTPPRSPSRLASPPTYKTSSPPNTTTSPVQRYEVSVNQAVQLPSSTPVSDDTPEIKRSTEMADLVLDEKRKKITKVKGAQIKSTDPYSMDKIQETKSHKTKPTIARVPLHQEIKDDISKFIHKMATSPPKQYMDEKPASVITLAGDNRGASMHLGSDATDREGVIDIQKRSVHDDSINGEGSSKGKKSQKGSNTSENQETKAIINSNVQGINNSMMFNTSVTERSPGVHLGFSHNIENTKDSKMKKTESMDMHKAEADITPPQTLVYDPTIRRSHGGVFMESNDSDPNDREMSAKDDEIEVL